MKIPKTAFIFLLKCTGALFSVLTAILLSKYLGDDFLGKYSLSLTVIAVCAILASLGQHVVIMKNYVHRKKDSVNRTYASFFICLVTSIFIIPFLYYVLYRIDGQVAPIFLALFILLVLISLKTPVWTVNEKFFINSLVDDFIRPAITLIFAILLAVNIFFGGGIRTFSISMLLMVVTLTVVLFVAYHTIKLLDFKWEILCNVTLKSEVHSVVKSGYLVLFISLLQLMLNQFDRVFIANFNGYSDLGVYFKAQTIVYILNYFVQSVILRINPKLVKLNNEGKLQELSVLSRKYSLISFLFGLSVCVLLLAFIPMLEMIFNIDNELFSISVYILMLSQSASMLFGFGSTIMLYSENSERKRLLFFMVVSMFVSIILWVSLINHYGIVGAAIGTGVGYVLNRLLPSIYYRFCRGISLGVLL